MTLSRTVTTAAAVLALGLGAAACGGDDEKKSDAAASKTPTVAATVDPDRVSPKNLPAIPVIQSKGLQGARKDVEFTKCPTKSGPVELTATVKNSGKEAKDYALVVSWINSTNDELGRAVGTVEGLAPGATEKVKLAAKLDVDVPVTCAYNVTRGTLRG